ncbi:MAG: response regulator, partial [Lachnospiraceae bacterium]|nr:response regulator [Lachnospiraceae bacterium]
MGNWVVVVDDVQLILTSAEEILKKAGMRVSTLSSGKELLSFMESNSPDLVLLDIIMPDMDGFDTYRALR